MKSVSLIITAYNAEREIAKAVKSIKKQDFKGKKEIIVVNDASKDRTAEALKKIKNIKVATHKKNKGLAAALSTGAKTAKNDIVFVFHQDMRPSSKKLVSEAVKVFDDENVVACGAPFIIPEKNWRKFNILHKILTVNLAHPKNLKKVECFLAYKREILLKIGLWDNKAFATAGEDFDIAFKLKKHGTISSITTPVHHLEGPNRASLIKQLLKNRQQGEAHGVLFRKYGFKMYGLKLVFLKTALLISLLIQGINVFSLILLLVIGAVPLTWVYPKVKDYRLILLPFINVVKYAVYTAYFWRGFVTKKQTYRY
jgi:glycosyltransferase involved in cell wall biosynthesis